jgi:CRP/FNR family transcriptional regulator, cyclic AMP receptor protein
VPITRQGRRCTGSASTGVQAAEPSIVFRISARTLTEAARRDARVSWAIAEELNRRLYGTLEQTAVNAFGSVRQRVAAHLLDLAAGRQRPGGRLVARVSQQELADAAGSSTRPGCTPNPEAPPACDFSYLARD